MPRKRSAQKNYRLSADAISLLEQAAKKSNLTLTEVVELAVCKYASTIPGLAKSAHEAVVKILAKEFGQDQEKE